MRATLFALVLAATAAPARADAPDDTARAEQLYNEGLEHYNAERFARAIASWKQSFALSRAPILLFNIGQAYRRGDDCAHANAYYAEYERQQPDVPNRDELAEALALCKGVAPADVAFDAAAEPTPPTDEITPPPVTSPPVVDAPGGRSNTVAIALGATGVVLAGAGVFFAFDAGKQTDKLDNYSGEWGPEQASIESRGKRDVILAWTLGGAGVVALVTSTVLFLRSDEKAETSRVTVLPTSDGVHVGWWATF